MTESYEKILNNITKNVHQTFLKSLGFKKKRNTFNRNTSDGLTQVINFQAGRYEPLAIEVSGLHHPNALYGSFTINLGIFVPEYTFEEHKITEFVQEYDCAIRSRIGQLSNNEELLYWTPFLEH